MTAGGEDAQPRGRGKQLAGEHRAGVGEVLTVVEHHEEALRLEVGSEIGGRIGPLLGQRGAAACMPFATSHGRAAELSAVRYLVPLRAT